MRVYKALLHLYPVAFRNEYGDEMCMVFADRKREASGLLSRIALWLITVFDVVVNALRVHLDLLRQDLRYTWRTLSQAPGFALTVILVSGLGIGATTAVMTITDQVLIRPLPFPEPSRLVKFLENRPGYSRMELSPPNYIDWKKASTSFEEIGAYRGLAINMVGEGVPDHLDGTVVTADVFRLLGIRPVLGRIFRPEEDREGASPTVILSYRLWQARFGGDPEVLGKRVLLDGVPFLVIGVMPRDFFFPLRNTQIWIPMRFTRQELEDRSNNILYGIGRLKPGVTVEQAHEEFRVIAARLAKAYPRENARTSATTFLIRDEVSNQARTMLAALFGAALCVLLIACTNLANLMLARAMSRRKELAVRSSLGAGRERLIRQMLTESLTLAILGGLCGLLIANTALPLLTRLIPQSLPVAPPSIDPRVLGMALIVTVLTGLGFGVIPAIRAGSAASADGMREGSRSGAGGRKEKLRSALVVVEVTMCVVLVISAGLLIRALWQLQGVDPGFQTAGILTMRTPLPMPKYETIAKREQFYNRVLDDVRKLPGVKNAAYISFLPMTMRGGIWPVSIGEEVVDRAEGHSASLRFVTPGFFQALSIPLHLGRDVQESDTPESLFVAVVSQSFVKRHWPNENPLGRRFKFGFAERTVVGIVGDVKVRGLESTSEPQVYLPYKQIADGWLNWYAPKDLVVQSLTSDSSLASNVREIIRQVDSEQPISNVRPLADVVDADTRTRQVQVRVLGSFAFLAFLLAGIGIHGLLSFTVSQRSQEIGIRQALGAQRSDILRMVMRESVILALTGVTLGAALGYASGVAMRSLLVGIDPADTATFLAAVGLALVMTFAGSLIPALRALHIDPAVVMRAE